MPGEVPVAARDPGVSEPQDPDGALVARNVQLSRIYYGQSPGALRGPTALFAQAQEEGLADVTFAECKKFLASQPTYTLYRPARKHYPRNTIKVLFTGEVVQIDIMDLQRYRDNNDYLYVLLAYDTYSKYLQGFPLKNRKPDGIIAGLEAFMRGPCGINSIYWDKEGSFLSRQVQKFLKDVQIHNYTTKSVVKAPGVERVIRTIRMAMQRYFEHHSTTHWEVFLPQFIHSYNHRQHSTTKQRPIDVVENPLIIIPPTKTIRPTHPKVTLPPIGSYVRLNRLGGLFDKESAGSFTREIFQVTSHKNSPIPMIRVSDLQGEPIMGALYPEEYQSVVFDGKKDVEHVVKTRTRRGEKEYFVKYRGYPSKFNEWIKMIK